MELTEKQVKEKFVHWILNESRNAKYEIEYLFDHIPQKQKDAIKIILQLGQKNKN